MSALRHLSAPTKAQIRRLCDAAGPDRTVEIRPNGTIRLVPTTNLTLDDEDAELDAEIDRHLTAHANGSA